MRKTFLLFSCLLLLTTFAGAQINSTTYPFTASSGAVLEDMTSGTTQAVGSGNDDGSSGLVNIGFDYWFNGVRYTQLDINANGIVRLGTTMASSSWTNAFGSGATQTPAIAPYWDDLRTGTDGKVHYKVVGSAPSRKLVVEWSNINIPRTSTATAGGGTFQLWLSETTGEIDFVYGSGILANTANSGASIGLSASSTAFASITLNATSANSTCSYTTASNVNTIAISSGTRFNFATAATTPPTNLTFSDISQSSYKLTWNTGGPNVLGTAIYNSTDNVTFTYVTSVTSQEYVATGLSGGTTYYWNLYSYSQGWKGLPLAGNQNTSACGVYNTTYTVGVGGDFSSLTAASNTLGACGIADNVVLELMNTYVSSGETFPLVLGAVNSPGSNKTITIRPAATATGLSITSNNATATINISNGANWIIDGRPGGTGTNRELSIGNTGAAPAIRFINDASNNIARYLNVTSTVTSTSSGLIVFSTATSTGNDNNILEYNSLNGNGTAANIIYALGSTTTAAHNNSGNIIRHNNIFDQFVAGSATNGILISSGNTEWTIASNNFYQTSARTYTSGSNHIAITVSNSSGNGFIVENNFIGGSDAGATGSAWTIGGTLANRFRGISMTVGTTTASRVDGNTIANFSFTSSTSATTAGGPWCGIYVSAGNVNIGSTSGNIIGSLSGPATITATISTAGGISSGIFIDGGTTHNIDNNTIANIVTTGATSANSHGFAGVRVSSGTTIGITNNSIYSVTSPGVSSAMSGVNVTSGTTVTVAQNTINALSGSGTTSPTVAGIVVGGGTTVNVYKNKIYGLSQTGAITTTSGAVSGLQITAGTTVNAYNNLIGALTAPAAGLTDAIRAVNITSTSTSSTYRVYFNTIHLNASSSGTNFGTTGVYHQASSTATTAALDLRNNIIINLSTPAGTGVTAVLRRSAANTYGNWAAASNKNLLYAGTPGTNRVILADGASVYDAFGSYKTQVGGRDANSITGESFDYATDGTFFQSIDGSHSKFLHIVGGISTQIESGASPITVPNILDDYEGTTRNTTTPDIGADEFNGTTPAPSVTINSITPSSTQCVATARTVSATVTANGAAIAGATLRYQYNGGTAVDVAMTNTSGDIWEGVIPAATPGNATVTWSVIGTDGNSLSTSVSGGAYNDEPLYNFTTTITPNGATTFCSGGSVTLTASLPSAVPIVLGAGSTTSSSTNASFFPGSWGGAKTQYIIRASELTAAGMSAGTITSLAFEPTTSGQTYQGFYVHLGATSQTEMTTTFIPTTSLTQVYTGLLADNGFTPIANTVNTLAFGSGSGSSATFNWDGVSNIVVQVSWSRVPATNTATSTTMKVDATGFNSTAYRQRDNFSPADMLAETSANSVGTSRPRFTFGFAMPVSSYSWNDGTNTIGTSEAITVTPASTTNYTVTVTSGSCSKSSNAYTITVNPLPTAPTGTNSDQCGVAVPTASVADPNGFTTPTFNWYTVASGGTAVQSSTSTTFGSEVSTDTTFYVSVVNPTTNCESARTPVTVLISAPPDLSIDSAGFTQCEGVTSSLVSLTSNTSDFDSYTWSPASGVSGNESSGWTFAPTTTQTYTLTAANSETGCQNAVSITINVNPNPVVSAVNASPSTICNGSGTSISASSSTITSGTVTVGTTTGVSSSTSYPTAFGNYWYQDWQQILYTKDELVALGLNAGNITSLAFNVQALPSPATVNGYSIRIGSTNASTISTFTTAGLTTVYGPTNTTATLGWHQVVFTTPFNWDGNSNLIIDIRGTGAYGSANATVATNTISSRTIYAYTSSNNSNFWTSSPSATASSLRPDLKLWGEVATDVTSSYTWTWSPGGLSGTTVSVSPASTTTYTARATNSETGCFGENTVVVNVNPQPTAPSGTNSSQCGVAVPTASVSDPNSFTTPTFNWYTAASGGTAVQSSTATTFEGQVSSDTTFYVSVVNPATSCESPRTPVSVTIAPPPALTIDSTSFAQCQGLTSSAVNLTSDPGEFDSYTWSPASGVSGTSSSGWTFNPSSTTSYTLTSANSGTGCQNAVTLTVTVNANPVVSSVSASPSAVCVGTSTTLTALSSGSSANYTVGTASTTLGASSAGGLTPFGQYYETGRNQYLITASDLQTAGVVAGDLTSLSFTITTKNSTKPYTSYTINLATTTATTLSGGFVGAAGTQVYKASTASNTGYNSVVGVNTFAFGTGSGSSSSFAWDGTSNLIVEICFANDPSNAGTFYSNSDLVAATASKSYTATYSTWTDNANYCGSTAASNSGSSQSLPVISFTVNPSYTSSYNWSWSPASLTGSSVSVTPTATTTYTARATNAATGCYGENTVTVTVNNPVATPPATGSYVYGAANNTSYTTAANWYVYNGTGYEVATTAPGASANIVVPATSTCVLANPVLQAATTVNNMELQAGATLGLNGNDLSINGSVSGTGTITGSALSSLNIGGTAGTLYFGSGANTIKNIALSNGASATLGNALNIVGGATPGAVTVGTGATLTTGGFLTLQSDASGTAAIAQSGGTVSGDVTVERYIPASGNRAWRLLSAPLQDATAPTINAAWQEAGASTANYGTQIPKAGSATSINGFDAGNTNAASLQYWNGSAWAEPANTDINKITAHNSAWFLFVRGDRTVTTSTGSSNTTLRMKGAVNQGNVSSVGSAGAGFSLIPNPYPSTVDFEAIRSGNGNSVNTYYTWDATLGTVGAYRTVDRVDDDPTYEQTPSVSFNADNSARYIQSGQAFFIGTNGTLNFTESMKTASSPDFSVMRTTTPGEQVMINLYVKNNGNFILADGVREKYDDSYSANVTSEDVPKLNNLSDNLGIRRNTSNLVIEKRPFITSNDTIFLNLANVGIKQYRFDIDPVNLGTSGLEAYLHDAFLGTVTPLSLSAQTQVEFEVTATAGSYAANRFMIVMKPSATLPVSGLHIVAAQKEGAVQVDFTSLGEHNINNYQVQHSATGVEFTTLATLSAKANDGSNVSYTFAHKSPLAGLNYYRIKALDNSGKEQYSSIAKVKIETGKQGFAVYPNPVRGEVINLQMTNMAAGSYTVQLFNNLGQEVYRSSLLHTGGSATRSLNIAALSVQGTYTIKLSNGTSESKQTIVRQ